MDIIPYIMEPDKNKQEVSYLPHARNKEQAGPA